MCVCVHVCVCVICVCMCVCVQLVNVQVPFFFKHAVDYFHKAPALSSAEGTIITVGTALLLGCKVLTPVFLTCFACCRTLALSGGQQYTCTCTVPCS